MKLLTETNITVLDDDGNMIIDLGPKTQKKIGLIHKKFELELEKYLKKRLHKGKIGE